MQNPLTSGCSTIVPFASYTFTMANRFNEKLDRMMKANVLDINAMSPIT